MGYLQTIWRRGIENPNVPIGAVDDIRDIFGLTASASGVHVTRDTALTYSLVWKAVSLISFDLAKLPLVVYRRRGNGKEKAMDHPAYKLCLYSPNSNVNAFSFWSSMLTNALLGHGGYAYIDKDEAGAPTALTQFDSGTITPELMGDNLYYIYRLSGGGEVIYRRDQVLHIKGLSYDGITGLNTISFARESIGEGLALQEYSSRFFSNGASPRTVLEVPRKLSKQAFDNIRSGWQEMHSGLSNAHKTAILEEGTQAKILSVSPENAQLIEARNYKPRDIANWFRLPPHKLGDDTRTSFASLEQERQDYLDSALDPWARAIEMEVRDKLLLETEKADDSIVVEFLRQALIRVDMSTRFAAHNIALAGAPFETVNEVRAKENLDPIDGGDELMVPSNNFGQQQDENAAPGDDDDQDNQTDDEDDVSSSEDERSLLQVVISDMAQRVARDARAAAKDPQKLSQWVHQAHTRHAHVVRQRVAPVMRVVARHADSEDLIAWLMDQFTEAARGIVGWSVTANQSYQAMDEACDSLEADLPIRAIQRVYENGNGNGRKA